MLLSEALEAGIDVHIDKQPEQMVGKMKVNGWEEVPVTFAIRDNSGC